MSDVAFVCVAYETPQHLQPFARQILRAETPPGVQLIVVDNSAKPDAALEQLLGGEDRARYFHTGQNLGYFGAARLALEHLRERGRLPEWIVVSNVDLRFDIVEVVRCLDETTAWVNVGCVAPRLISQATGQEMNPFMRDRPTVARMWFLSAVFRFYATLQLYHWLGHWYHTLRSRWLPRRPVAATPGESIYAPHGAIFALSRPYFELGGNLNHGVFLFGEEITIAERVRDLGMKTVYEPRAMVQHLDVASTGHVRSRRIGKYMHEAAQFCFERYFRKHSGPAR